MLNYDFMKVAGEHVRTYREFPLPVIICDADFRVYWVNTPAKRHYPHLAETGGLQGHMAEFDREKLFEHLRVYGNCTLADTLPFSGTRLSVSPVLVEGEIVGVILFLLEGEVLPDPHRQLLRSKSAEALAGSIRDSMDEVFTALDNAAMKASLLEAPWLGPHLNRVSAGSYQILRVSTNISEYAKYQGGLLSLDRDSLNLFGWLREVREVVSSLGEQMGIPVTVSVPEEDLVISLDRARFELALFNLIHNGLFFTRPGNRISVAAGREEDHVWVTVRDQGIGISEDMRRHVLLPFVCHATGKRFAGAGLGLTLAKVIAEAHGGELLLASQAGVGTTVTMRFPYSPFSQKAPLSQGADRYTLGDRFSPLYIGLAGAIRSPYRQNQKG